MWIKSYYEKLRIYFPNSVTYSITHDITEVHVYIYEYEQRVYKYISLHDDKLDIAQPVESNRFDLCAIITELFHQVFSLIRMYCCLC